MDTRQVLRYPDFTFRFRRRHQITRWQRRWLTELRHYMARVGLDLPRDRMPARPPKLADREDEELEEIIHDSGHRMSLLALGRVD